MVEQDQSYYNRTDGEADEHDGTSDHIPAKGRGAGHTLGTCDLHVDSRSEGEKSSEGDIGDVNAQDDDDTDDDTDATNEVEQESLPHFHISCGECVSVECVSVEGVSVEGVSVRK